MLTMPSTEASARNWTTHPIANTISPVTRVNTARLFSSGCRWPSLFSDRGERVRVLAASGISATLLAIPAGRGGLFPHGTGENPAPAAGGARAAPDGHRQRQWREAPGEL